jgi:hypothetical protein
MKVQTTANTQLITDDTSATKLFFGSSLSISSFLLLIILLA